MENIKEILKKYKSIALVGASKDLTKTSSIVMKYLQDNGFKVYPVNPSMKGEKILGEKVFGNISEIDNPVEIVDVFRPSNEVVTIAEETVKINAKVLWLQLDIINTKILKDIKTIVKTASGYLTIIKIEENLKASIDVFTVDPVKHEISEKIKRSFDPKRIFNPGKMYSGI